MRRACVLSVATLSLAAPWPEVLACSSSANPPSLLGVSPGLFAEEIQPGEALRPAAIYDSNGAIVAAAINENGGNAVFWGAVPDDEKQLEATMRRALAESDMVVLSGGTSKGAGDVTHRIIARLGNPGIICHGVALKPGDAPLKPPLAVRIINALPWLQGVTARFIGLGVRPEHVQSKKA